MLTLLHITTEKTEELEIFRERIEAELAHRELAQRQESRSPAVVEERSRRSGTLRLERVKCGKDRCKKCAEGGATARIGTCTFAATGSSPAATSAKSCRRSSGLFTELLMNRCFLRS